MLEINGNSIEWTSMSLNDTWFWDNGKSKNGVLWAWMAADFYINGNSTKCTSISLNAFEINGNSIEWTSMSLHGTWFWDNGKSIEWRSVSLNFTWFWYNGIRRKGLRWVWMTPYLERNMVIRLNGVRWVCMSPSIEIKSDVSVIRVSHVTFLSTSASAFASVDEKVSSLKQWTKKSIDPCRGPEVNVLNSFFEENRYFAIKWANPGLFFIYFWSFSHKQ